MRKSGACGTEPLSGGAWIADEEIGIPEWNRHLAEHGADMAASRTEPVSGAAPGRGVRNRPE